MMAVGTCKNKPVAILAAYEAGGGSGSDDRLVRSGSSSEHLLDHH